MVFLESVRCQVVKFAKELLHFLVQPRKTPCSCPLLIKPYHSCLVRNEASLNIKGGNTSICSTGTNQTPNPGMSGMPVVYDNRMRTWTANHSTLRPIFLSNAKHHTIRSH